MVPNICGKFPHILLHRANVDRFFNIVNECAFLLVCIFKNINFAAVLLRLLFVMFIICFPWLI